MWVTARDYADLLEVSMIQIFTLNLRCFQCFTTDEFDGAAPLVLFAKVLEGTKQQADKPGIPRK